MDHGRFLEVDNPLQVYYSASVSVHHIYAKIRTEVGFGRGGRGRGTPPNVYDSPTDECYTSIQFFFVHFRSDATFMPYQM